jgi:membrane fusion protein (multidrug efflux system)
MTDLDQEGISRRLRARFVTYQAAPPRHRLAFLAAAAVVVLSFAYGLYIWNYWRHHISTDDAFISAHMAPLSARVPGTVIEVRVNDNQDVKAEQVLLRLDPRDYEVAVAQARAAVASAKGDLENAVANVPLTDESTRSLVQQADAALGASEHGNEMARHDLDERRGQIEAKQAAAAAADAAVRSAAADYDRSKADRDRIAALVKNQLVAQQDMDHAEATYRTAEATLEAARKRLDQARSEMVQAEASLRTQQAAVAQAVRRVDESRASLENARSQRQQVRLRQTQVEAAQGRLAQALANLQQAELNLVYCTIRAPMAGRRPARRGARAGGDGGPVTAHGSGSRRCLGGGQLQGDRTDPRPCGAVGLRHGRYLSRQDLQGARRLDPGRIGRGVLAPAARERHRELREGGAAGAGEVGVRAR